MTETPPHDYPLFLQLAGRPVLVAGGGPVAARRVARLLDTEALVTVVSPWTCEDIREWDAAGRIVWHRREFHPDDVAAVWLVHACTGDAVVDDAVVAAAEERRIWSVRASDASDSPAWSAATANTVDGVQFAVNGGRDPTRALALRDAITTLAAEGRLPIRRRRRPQIGGFPPEFGPGNPRFGVSETTGSGGGSSGRRGGGTVYLVGGGPGDPDLMTVRARRLLSLADVVVTDRLAPVAALEELAHDVEVVDVGKSPGRHALPQEEINQLLVDRARLGKVVVRFKGGDPFVLGRGGEEALACAAAGVTVEVVPGVTSAISVPAAAGIPVTHRGLSTSTLIVSAHDGADEVVRRAGCTPPDTTLVLLMGVRHLAEIADALIVAGRPAALPAAVVADGWTTNQQVVTGPLAEIAARAAAAEVGSPAVVVVGEVAALHETLGELGHASEQGRHAAQRDPA